MGIGKAQTIAVGNIRGIRVSCHPRQFSIGKISAVAIVSQVETVEERCRRTIPIGRSLVASSIIGIGIVEALHGFVYLLNGLLTTHGVAFAKHHAGEPVRTDPGIPVHACFLPPVVGGKSGREHTACYLIVYPFCHHRRKAVYLLLQCALCPRHESCCLGIEEIDVLVLSPHHLCRIVGWYSPPRLFECTLQAIDDVAHKPSFVFRYLRHDKCR